MRIAVRTEAQPSARTGSATAPWRLTSPIYSVPESGMPVIKHEVANVVAILFGLTAAIAAMLLFASGW